MINQQAGWIDLAKQLVAEVSGLCSRYTESSQPSSADDLLSSDLTKLRQAANKLQGFIRNYTINPTEDKRQLWHELRNLIGTIQGYSELIMEDDSPCPTLNAGLQSIRSFCDHVLQQDNAAADHFKQVIPQPAGRQIESSSILVVDDQSDSRDILRRYLSQDRHRILEASSGQQMLQMLVDHPVDLILLDLVLPEMDGYELLQQVKQHEQWRAIPVVVVSGIMDKERVIRCIEAGAEDYLFKPFNPVLLRARINAGVERKRWHDREQRYRQELERNQSFIRNVFGRYLSEEIVETLLEHPDGLDLGGIQTKVTVLMADIRGFTPICESLPPQRIVRLLNYYLGTMTDIIMDHNGTVDEFIGDAILAIFGAPVSRPNDADSAIRCALAMQKAMDSINAFNRQEDLPEVEIGISLNTGLVVAGNIGSKKRAKYGVVGHTVNETARIEEKCPAGKILISESTLIDARSLLAIGERKTLKAKGIEQEIAIYELLDTHCQPN